MKKILLALALITGSGVASYAQAPAPAPAPKDRLNDKKAPRFAFVGGDTHDFGTLQLGPPAVYVFQFKNTGKEPLIIKTASASCGCTVPEYPKEPIMPGKTASVKVTYTTTGHPGPFMKTVYIESNAATDKPRYEIYIKGTVTPPATPVAPPAVKG